MGHQPGHDRVGLERAEVGPHLGQRTVGSLDRAPTSLTMVMAGTGLFTEIFLKNGNRVFGVEPNAEMRRAGEQALKDYPTFTSVNGTAETSFG